MKETEEVVALAERVLDICMQGGTSISKVLEQVSYLCAESALTMSDGCRSKAARLLGINRTTLVMQMRKFGYKKFPKPPG